MTELEISLGQNSRQYYFIEEEGVPESLEDIDSAVLTTLFKLEPKVYIPENDSDAIVIYRHEHERSHPHPHHPNRIYHDRD